jgi:hypothetical protein
MKNTQKALLINGNTYTIKTISNILYTIYLDENSPRGNWHPVIIELDKTLSLGDLSATDIIVQNYSNKFNECRLTIEKIELLGSNSINCEIKYAELI